MVPSSCSVFVALDNSLSACIPTAFANWTNSSRLIMGGVRCVGMGVCCVYVYVVCMWIGVVCVWSNVSMLEREIALFTQTHTPHPHTPTHAHTTRTHTPPWPSPSRASREDGTRSGWTHPCDVGGQLPKNRLQLIAVQMCTVGR